MPNTATTSTAALRILDANLNRAREGLRTAEEFARLGVNDAPRAVALKDLRHRLDTLFRAPAVQRALLSARDVAHDAGAGTTLQQQHAARAKGLAPADVARAALKRAAEALRNIEEYLPSVGASLGASARVNVGAAAQPRPRTATAVVTAAAATTPARWPAPATVAALRYTLYDLERDLFLTADRAQRLHGRVLCLLWSPELYSLSAERALAAAAAGACAAKRPDSLLIQLRVKNCDDGPLLKHAAATQRLCEKLNLPLILNDRPLVALHAGCAGVHLGQTDLPPQLARELLGPAALIGLSTHSAAQLRAARREPVDYVGLGPMFATRTKAELVPQGLTLAKSTRTARRELNLPVFAIGGIGADNLPGLVKHGLRAAAVSGAAFASNDPKNIQHAVAALLRLL